MHLQHDLVPLITSSKKKLAPVTNKFVVGKLHVMALLLVIVY